MIWVYRLLETPLWVLLTLAVSIASVLFARLRFDHVCITAAKTASKAWMSGGSAAAELLRAAGLPHVAVRRVERTPRDYYDTVGKVVRLSPWVHDTPSLAAIALAAREVGHALQHAGRDAPQHLATRDAVTVSVRLGTIAALLLVGVGFVLDIAVLTQLGAVVLLGSLAVQLTLIPLHRDAGRRARRALAMAALIDSSHEEPIARVIDAAFWSDLGNTLPRLGKPVWQRLAPEMASAPGDPR